MPTGCGGMLMWSPLHLYTYKVPNTDADVKNVKSVCNPLYHEVDVGVFEHFSVLPNNFLSDPHFLTLLEPGATIIKLAFG